MRRQLGDILSFSLPVVLVPLADPIMSVMDSVCLGRLADATALAALGPCSLLLNFSSFVFNALSIATVALVTGARRRGDAPAAAAALSTSLALGAAGGAAVLCVLQAAGPALLAATGADPVLLPAATTYLRIRALGLPASILVQVAQAGLLAQRDSLTPFRTVLATSLLSLAGNLLLVGALGWGVAGAAATTVAAQALGAALLLRALRRSAVRPEARLPRAADLRAMASTFGALTVFYVCKNLSYLLLQLSAARMPTLALAAHQPVWSLWCLVSFTNTPLEQAALAFVPGAPSPRERQETVVLLLGLGLASGVVGTFVAVGLPALAPGLFAADPALWPLMRSVALQGALALLCCGADVSATGVLFALRDVRYVARAMAACLALLGAFMATQRGSPASLATVWWGLVVFFGARAAQSVQRVWRTAIAVAPAHVATA